MNRARIIGYATSIVKHDSLMGQKLLIAQAISTDGTPEGDPQIVYDNLGAGVGDLVLISSDGSYTRNEVVRSKLSPARWSIVGVIDSAKKTDTEE
ncbi:MAG: EutN/CcmL family microcompartment protein [Thermoguttaceae bacterium]|jgi:ethanolamine utilization protein EutN